MLGIDGERTINTDLNCYKELNKNININSIKVIKKKENKKIIKEPDSKKTLIIPSKKKSIFTIWLA